MTRSVQQYANVQREIDQTPENVSRQIQVLFDRNASPPKRGGLRQRIHRQKESGRAAQKIDGNRFRNRQGDHKIMNFKQEELLEQFIDDIKGKYSEIQFVKVIESPEDPESHWVYVTAPEDEDREMELVRYASEKAMDILCDYGYQFLIMPTKRAELQLS